MTIRRCYSCGTTIMSETLPTGWREQTLYEFDMQHPETQPINETRYACSDSCADRTYPGWVKPVTSEPQQVEG